MNPNGVPLAARQERPSVTAPVVVMVTSLARCSLRFVPSAERIPKCPLNPVKADPYIAVSASAK
jgi:hypothetical protein